jgi:sec-independent protein translocase protein TatA
MVGDLFDSPWKIAIIAVLIIVLFGAKKLPSAARSLGQSMRILKKEVQGLHEDEAESDTSAPGSTEQAATAPAQIAAAPAPVAATPAADQQAQIDALQQQLRDMQRAAAMDPVASGKQDTVNQQS